MGVATILCRWSGMGLLEKATTVQRLEGGEGVSLAEIGGKRLPGAQNSQCKHSKLGACMIECCAQKEQETRAGWSRMNFKMKSEK